MAQQVTEKYEETYLYKIRHSAAHVMAQAVMEIFPDGKPTIGPPVENGFYYDFDLPRNLTPEDLEAIEKRMRQIVQGKHDFKKTVISGEEAKKIWLNSSTNASSASFAPDSRASSPCFSRATVRTRPGSSHSG